MDEQHLINAYERLRAQRLPGRPRKYEPEIAKQREREAGRRRTAARQQAEAVLRELHRDEYEVLYRHAFDDINMQRGPLPGDKELDT